MLSPSLISILLPVKNTALYLPTCLDSILTQSIPNWELIAINDHSTDESFAILQAYAQKDPRIKVFNNNGQGIIEALRLAYHHSKGAYITRMDSDDRMTEHKLATLQKDLLQHGQGHIAIGQVKYFTQAILGLGEGYQKYEAWLNQLSQAGTNYQDIYRECVIPSPCWMVHRVDLDRCGAFVPDRYPEDYDLCFRFYQQSLKIIPSDTVLHYWRDYPERTSRTDPNYADSGFLAIKMHYFLQLNYLTDHALVLWGAGKKGKWIARYLIEKNIPFHWICNNPNKIGKEIYGCIMKEDTFIAEVVQPQCIIAVANVEAQQKIRATLNQLGTVGKDFFFFS